MPNSAHTAATWQGVCHCDSNPSNFLYTDGKLSAVLDFDQASYTWLLYDVAQMIYWWTWPKKGDIQLDKSSDLVAHYETVRKLSDDSFSNDKRKVVDLNALECS
jgi:Ser/Thr protein kinase RdoA (MazF antagonist)